MSSDQARRAAMAAAQVAAQGGATSGNASVTAVDGDDNSVATGGSRGGMRGVGGDLTSGGEDNSDAGIAGSHSAAGQPDAALISAHAQRSTPASLPGQVPGSDAGSDGESTEFWDGVDLSVDETLDRFDFDISGFNKKKDEIPFQKTRDKIYFTLGVANVCTIAYGAGGHPGFLTYFYTMKFPLLIAIRYFFYKGRKWHLFLLDFCYFANLLLLAYLWLFNDRPEALMMIFGVTTGPLAWAVLAFRNSLVFHSLDKITSAFIHITPVTLTFLLRHRTSLMWSPGYVDCNVANVCKDQFFWLTIAPTGFFIAHQVLYWILLKWVLCVPDDPCYLTSFRYLTADKRSAFYKLTHLLGGRCQELLFSFFYTLFAFVTMLPAYLWFRYEWANFAYVCIVVIVAVWNGANFYVEVFARGYGGRPKSANKSERGSKRGSKSKGKGNKAPPRPPKPTRSVSFLAR